jgi:hypothetical protein
VEALKKELTMIKGQLTGIKEKSTETRRGSHLACCLRVG